MNWNWYNQITERFTFATDPLWKFFSEYPDSPFLGILLLGLIAITHPSQITSNLGAITHITNHMNKANWLKFVISLFGGKIVGVYAITSLILWSGERTTLLIESLRNVSGPFFLLASFIFLKEAIRKNNREIKGTKKRIKVKRHFLINGFLIGFFLSLIIDPGVLLLLNMFTPWMFDTPYGLTLPFLFSLVMFIPVFIYSVLTFAFEIDLFIKKKLSNTVPYLLFLILMLIAFNEFLLYWG